MKNEGHTSPNIRRGKFLWMDPEEKNMFINTLKSRIAEGYYFSDKVFTKVAEEISPVLSELTGD